MSTMLRGNEPSHRGLVNNAIAAATNEIHRNSDPNTYTLYTHELETNPFANVAPIDANEGNYDYLNSKSLRRRRERELVGSTLQETTVQGKRSNPDKNVRVESEEERQISENASSITGAKRKEEGKGDDDDAAETAGEDEVATGVFKEGDAKHQELAVVDLHDAVSVTKSGIDGSQANSGQEEELLPKASSAASKHQDDEAMNMESTVTDKTTTADSTLRQEVARSEEYNVNQDDEEKTKGTDNGTTIQSTPSKTKDEDHKANQNDDKSDQGGGAVATAYSTSSKLKDEDDKVTKSSVADSAKKAAAEKKNEDDAASESTEKNDNETVQADSALDEVAPTSKTTKTRDEDDEVTESAVADSAKNGEADSTLDVVVTTTEASKMKDGKYEVTETDETNVQANSTLNVVAATSGASAIKDEDDETESTVTDRENNVKVDPSRDSVAATTQLSRMKDVDDKVTESTVADSEKNVKGESTLDEFAATSTASKMKDKVDVVTESTVADSEKNVKGESTLDAHSATSEVSKMKDEDDEVTESTVADNKKNATGDSTLDEVTATSEVSKRTDEDDEVSEATVADSAKNVKGDPSLDADSATSKVSKMKDEDDEVSESTVADNKKNVKTDPSFDVFAAKSEVSKMKDEDDEVTESTVADSAKNATRDSTLDEVAADDSAKNVNADPSFDVVAAKSEVSKMADEDDEVTESTEADSEKNMEGDSTLDLGAATSGASDMRDEDDEVTESTVSDSETNVKADPSLDSFAATSKASNMKDEDNEVAESTVAGSAENAIAESALDGVATTSTAPKVNGDDEKIQVVSTIDEVATTSTASKMNDEDDDVTERTGDKNEVEKDFSVLGKDAKATAKAPGIKDDDDVTGSYAADNSNVEADSMNEDTALSTAPKLKEDDDDDELTQTTNSKNAFEFESISKTNGTTFTASNTKDEDNEVNKTDDKGEIVETDYTLDKHAILPTSSEAKDEDNKVSKPSDGDNTAYKSTMITTEHLNDGGEVEKSAKVDSDDVLANKANEYDIVNKEATPAKTSKVMAENAEEIERTDDDDGTSSLQSQSNKGSNANEVTRLDIKGEVVGTGSGHQNQVNDFKDTTPSMEFNANVSGASISTIVFSFDNLECKDRYDYVYAGETDARRSVRFLASQSIAEDDGMGIYKPAEGIDDANSGGESNVSSIASSTMEYSTEQVMDCSYVAKHPEICAEVVHLHVHRGNLSNLTNSHASFVEGDIINGSKSANYITRVENSSSLATSTKLASNSESLSPTSNMYEEEEDGGSGGKIAADNNQVRRTKSVVEEVVAANVPSVAGGESQELNGLKQASASANPSGASGPENNIVITIGSLYCPVSCNVISQCEVARDHFTSVDHGHVADEVTQEGNAADATGTTAEGEASNIGTDMSPKEVRAPKNIHGFEDEEVSDGGSEIPLCSDDASFLYKGYIGFDCEYIKVNKPEKCTKEYNGQLIGVVSCPVSCKMVDKCKALYSVENEVSGEATSTPAKAKGSDEAANPPGQKQELSTTLSPSDVESSINTPNDDATNTSSDLHMCKDDPTFLYKGFEGYDCYYIKENKPEKCMKEHNGQMIGVVSCPVSCGMVEQCQNTLDKSDGNTSANKDDIDSKEDSQHGSGHNDNAEDIEDKNEYKSTHEADVANIKDMNSEVFTAAGTVLSEGEQSPATSLVSSTTDQVNSSTKEVFENATDDNKRPVSSSLCKDDPTFLYKDKDGYTCQFIGDYKADKCNKEHNGRMIGIFSCPESCDMVDKCLLSFESTTANSVANHDPCKDLATFRLNGEPDKDCLWISQNERCELEHDETGRIIGKYFCPEACGLLEVSCFVGGTAHASLSDGGTDDPESSIERNKTYEGIEESTKGQNVSGDGLKSSSENSDVEDYKVNDQDKNSSAEQDRPSDEKWEVLEHEVQEEFRSETAAQPKLENETKKEVETNSASLMGTGIEDGFTSNTEFNANNESDSPNNPYGNSFNSDTKYEDDDGYAYRGSGFQGYKADNYGEVNGYGYEDESSWNQNGITGSFTEENSAWNTNDNVNYEPSSASWNSDGQNSGQILEPDTWSNPTGNSVSVSSETWDDDEDDFPVGMLLLFLVLLAVFLYWKKSRADRALQGGYQRVEPIDRSMYMNKRR